MLLYHWRANTAPRKASRERICRLFDGAAISPTGSGGGVGCSAPSESIDPVSTASLDKAFPREGVHHLLKRHLAIVLLEGEAMQNRFALFSVATPSSPWVVAA